MTSRACANSADDLVRAPATRACLQASDPWIVAALLAVWAVCNPYFSVDRGGLIYTGRALADLDPAGVGQDMMFRLDGQSGFTIFTPIFRLLVASLGAGPAMLLVGAAATLASFAGAVYLARRLAPGRTAYLAIAFAAALPAAYGGYQLFSYAETAVAPRPFAEALVLCGLAMLLDGRRLQAALAMTLAMALHPIMALPGVGVLVVWTAAENRRWAVFWLLIAGACLALAIAGAPPFDRMRQTLDPEWKSILVSRNPHLFPSLWPFDWTGRAATRAATLLIAAGLTTPPIRRLFLVTLIVGFAGLAASYFLGDQFSLLLVMQAQTWRMMWLVFALATIAAAICVDGLARGDWIGRVSLAFLALAWVYADFDLPAAALATTALVIRYAIRAEDLTLPTWVYVVALATAGLAIVAGLCISQLAFLNVLASAPAGFVMEARSTLAVQGDYTPIAALAALWFVLGPARLPRALLVCLGVAAVPVTAATWDQRSVGNRFFDSEQGFHELESIVAQRPGEVLWIGGLRANWWWLHRPHWAAAVQGAGLVFSRELAIQYRDRAQRAEEAGLADDALESPFAEQAQAPQLRIEPATLSSFCSAPDAPAWIVAPVNGSVDIAEAVARTEVRSPVAKLEARLVKGALVWSVATRYAVIPCAKP